MNLRRFIAVAFLTFLYTKAFPQKSNIVDDTTVVIYGTNTTKVFNQDVLYREQRVFFNKDTLFSRPLTKKNIFLPLEYKRPALYSEEELMAKHKADSLALLKKSELKASERDTTYFYKEGDTLKEVSKPAISYKQGKYNQRFYKNYYNYFKPDTSLDDIHNYNMIYINDNIYQNLGIMGTASKPVFYVQPTELGYQSGFNVYNQYATDPSKVKYYNTRSPYTNFYYMSNTGGEDRVKIDFNRNITRNWNLGLSYDRINNNKQIGLTSINQRGLLLGQDLVVYTSLKSNNERYHLLGNFTYFIQRVNEQGGLKTTLSDGTTIDQAQVPEDLGSQPIWLNASSSSINPWVTQNNIYSRDRRVGYHLYHQYDIFNQGRLAIFHEFDRRNQKYSFGDPTVVETLTGTDFYKADTARFRDSSSFHYQFSYTTNKIGLKGTIGNGNLKWIGFIKNRKVYGSRELTIINIGDAAGDPFGAFGNFFLNEPKARISLSENYAGGQLIFKYNDSIYLDVKGEAMLYMVNNSDDSLKEAFKYKGDHQLSATLKYYNMEAGINRIQTAPSMLQNYSMNNDFYYWRNNLAAQVSHRAYFNIKFKAGRNSFEFTPSFLLINNYIYFDSLIRPTQVDSKTFLKFATLDVKYRTNLWKIHFDLYGKYTFKPDGQPDVVRFPEIYANARIYLKIVPKSKIGKQEFRFGFDLFYRSAYYGDAYMPSISQFYVQDDFKLNSNTLIDFFASAKMRNARVFFRLNQFNTLLQLTRGYYISPYYPAIQPNATFGFQWLLFD